MNLFFTGGLGRLADAFDAMAAVGFSRAKTGGDQWFLVELAKARELHRNDESIDDAGGWVRWRRMHSRLYHHGRVDSESGLITAAPVHNDEPKPLRVIFGCGEVATSFNGPRDVVASRLARKGHEVTRIRIRERRSVRQCDGSRVAPDGWIVFVG